MKIKSFSYIKHNLIKYEFFKYLDFFLPVVIIFSSLKIFGYVCFFIFYFPYIFFKRKEIILSIKNSNLQQFLVLIYFLSLIISVLYGSFFIEDIRVAIFFIPLIITFISVYFKNIFDFNNYEFYKKNYLKIIYFASVSYFCFYLLVNIFSLFYFGNVYQIQDNIWMGSSGAFSISSLLFFSLYKLWEKINYNLFSNYFLVFLIYIFHVLLNESRLGIVYIVTFTIFVSIRKIQLKRFLSLTIFLSISLSSYTISSSIMGSFYNNFTETKVVRSNERNIIYDTRNLFQPSDNRSNELIKGYRKFKEYPLLNKLIGTGWYSSRITINSNSNELKKGRINHNTYPVYHMQGIVALILDTGILGSLFLFTLVALNIINQLMLKDNLTNKLFNLSMISIVFLCLFIGYSLVNIAYVLFMLPDGITYFKNNNLNSRNSS